MPGIETYGAGAAAHPLVVLARDDIARGERDIPSSGRGGPFLIREKLGGARCDAVVARMGLLRESAWSWAPLGDQGGDPRGPRWHHTSLTPRLVRIVAYPCLDVKASPAEPLVSRLSRGKPRPRCAGLRDFAARRPGLVRTPVGRVDKQIVIFQRECGVKICRCPSRRVRLTRVSWRF